MSYELIGAIIFIVGIVVAGASLLNKQKMLKIKKLSRFWGIIVGGILIVAGSSVGGYAYLEDWYDSFAVTETVTIVGDCPTFDITPSATDVAVLNEAKDGYTIPARANVTAHTLIQEDNSTAWATPTISFLVDVNPFVGATQDDLATIYYEVTDADLQIDTSSDSYYMFTKSGGNRQCIWTGSGTEYVDGTHTMLMTENVTLALDLTVNQDSMSRIETIYSPVKVYVRFWNDCGWSETFTCSFELIGTFG